MKYEILEFAILTGPPMCSNCKKNPHNGGDCENDIRKDGRVVIHGNIVCVTKCKGEENIREE